MRLRIGVIVTAAVVGVAAVGGCSSDQVVRNGNPTPPADLSEPDQVISNALREMFTWNPVTEDSPAIAYRNAGAYLSFELANQADTIPTPGSTTQWHQWRSDGVAIVAEVFLLADETPLNSPTEMHRVAQVVQKATSGDSRIDEIERTAWAIAEEFDEGWRVTSVQFS